MKIKIVQIFVGLSILSITTIFALKLFNLSRANIDSGESIELIADFSSSDGIEVGSDVKISGIKIGSVLNKSLTNNYKARITIEIPSAVKIPNDSTLAIVSSGLFGGKYVEIKIGSEEEFMSNGQKFESTQGSINIEELIGKFAFSK